MVSLVQVALKSGVELLPSKASALIPMLHHHRNLTRPCQVGEDYRSMGSTKSAAPARAM